MKQEIIRRTTQTGAKITVREAGQGKAPSRIITGYAILFGVPSAPLYSDQEGEAREVIARTAVPQTLLDKSDIKMTMFHDRQLILARSNNGKGTLKYFVDSKGVRFEFEAPKTVDGDKALELVRRGDISGCSFAFTTYYHNTKYVSRSAVKHKGKTVTTYTVKVITGIFDFTLAADPAYPDTSVDTRDLFKRLNGKAAKQVQEMKKEANKPMIV